MRMSAQALLKAAKDYNRRLAEAQAAGAQATQALDKAKQSAKTVPLLKPKGK